MKFELNPTMILTKEELGTLDNALKLCRDMDLATSIDNCIEYEDNLPHGCEICPKRNACNKRVNECVFIIAHKALKEIIDMAVVIK